MHDRGKVNLPSEGLSHNAGYPLAISGYYVNLEIARDLGTFGVPYKGGARPGLLSSPALRYLAVIVS